MHIKFYLLLSCLVCSNTTSLFSFKLNRVIIASDTNPMYLDFWPVIARAWKQIIGIQPTLALISDKDIVIDTSVGDVLRFKPIKNVSTAQQAQLIRLLIPLLYENDFCITADIDMLPISKAFFLDNTAHVPDNKMVTFHDGNYGHDNNGLPKRISLCYIAGKGKIFKEIFQNNISNSLESIICAWAKGYEQIWDRDEQIATQYLLDWHKKTNRCIFLGQNDQYIQQHRIDRHSNLPRWNRPYDINLIRQGWYHDCHMLRPFNKFRKEIEKLVSAIQ